MNGIFSLAAGAAQAAEPSVLVVAGTGISLVFLVLILLTFIIALQGKIFDALEAKKRRPAAEPAPAQPAAALPEEPMEVPPMADAGVSPEIVAVIAAAVAAASGGKYVLRAVKRADRSAWAAAGVKSGTEPF